MQPLDVVVLGRSVAAPLLGDGVHDDGPLPFGRVGQGLLEPADVVTVDGAGVTDAERLEEGMWGDHFAEGAGQAVDTGIGEVAEGGDLAQQVADPLPGLDVGGVEAEMGEAE